MKSNNPTQSWWGIKLKNRFDGNVRDRSLGANKFQQKQTKNNKTKTNVQKYKHENRYVSFFVTFARLAQMVMMSLLLCHCVFSGFRTRRWMAIQAKATTEPHTTQSSMRFIVSCHGFWRKRGTTRYLMLAIGSSGPMGPWGGLFSGLNVHASSGCCRQQRLVSGNLCG